MGACDPSAIPVTVMQPGFVNRGPTRGSEATHGREIFENLCMKTASSLHIKCHRGRYCDGGIDQSPTPPFLKFLLFQSMGGGGGDMGPSAFSYGKWQWCSQDLQQGAKARERSADRAGGGGGFPPVPRYGDFWKFGYENGILLHIKCHY